MKSKMAGLALAASLVAGPAFADEAIKIGYIDPLSGGGASIGEIGLKTFQYLADQLNAAGGPRGQEIRDRRVRQQDQSAGKSDPGAKGRRSGYPHHHAGQRLVSRGGAVGLGDQVQRPQSRQGNTLPQLCGGRSGSDQRQMFLLAFSLGRQFRHQDGGADEFHEDAPQHQEALSDQPGLFVRPGGAHGGPRDAQGKAARHRDRRRRTASAAQDHRFFALYRQDQGLGSGQRDNRQLGPGFRAAAEGGGRRRPASRLVYLLCGRGGRPHGDQADRAVASRIRDHRRGAELGAGSRAKMGGRLPRQTRRQPVLSARRERDAHARQGGRARPRPTSPRRWRRSSRA